MRLKNKKTGEIGYLYANKNENYNVLDADDKVLAVYHSLAELNEEWEDYEEPKAYYIGRCGTIEEFDPTKDVALTEMLKEIGNYFETKEDAEKAVKKLKAWKRLEDKGFRFKGYTDDSGDLFSCQVIRCSFDYSGNYTESRKDLDLLFGGEE